MEKFKNIINQALLKEEDIENKEIKNVNETIDLNNLDFSKVIFLDNEMENSKLEKVSFADCKFENCNFSNSIFENVSFVRCKFSNCKFTGVAFSNCRFKDIDFCNMNASYCNFTMSFLYNFKFINSILKNSYFQENKTQKISFFESDLTRKPF